MTQHKQGDQGTLENFEASLEGGFEWLERNRRTVAFGVVAALVAAGLIAVAVEWSSRKEAAGQMAVVLGFVEESSGLAVVVSRE